MRRLLCWLRGRSQPRPTALLRQLASGGPLPEHPKEAQWGREAERVVMMDGDTDLITGLRPRFDGAGHCVGVHARSCRYPDTACYC